jgi:hypothetical protein
MSLLVTMESGRRLTRRALLAEAVAAAAGAAVLGGGTPRLVEASWITV